MSGSAIPAPGLVHGVYPQRDDTPEGLRVHLRTAGLKLLDRLGGRGTSHYLRKADAVLEREQRFARLDDGGLRRAAEQAATLLRQHGLRHAALLDAVAIAREQVRRETGLLGYRNQVCATLVMLDGRLAEMHTGEGKTLATFMAALAAALAGIPVHVITANDFLVGRDADQLRPVAARIGLRTGAITTELDPEQRRDEYACDIVYCTGKELVFDYLRDRLTRREHRHDLHHRLARLGDSGSHGGQPVLRGLCLALIDEADSILLDEATTPLILSRQGASGMTETHYRQAMKIARRLDEGLHYRCIPDSREITLTPRGRTAIGDRCRHLPGLWRIGRFQRGTVTQALVALHRYERDRDYLVRDDKVHIIDPTTGRIAEGRQWSKGLHQFIELKEGCPLSDAFQPMARITFQRFFPRYLRLGGTSATLREARGELLSLYALPVVAVPLHRPSRRRTAPPVLHATAERKWARTIERTRQEIGRGRPVLIATESVRDSDTLSALLDRAGIEHVVLNARQDAEEAAIVARAGRAGAVTVATNMAGRGTDITIPDEVKQRGGLHVISCQLNGARRIERQLHGRCARQGSPGSVETILSLEESLFRQYLLASLQRWLRRYRNRRDAPLPGWLARLLPALVRRRHEQTQRRIRATLRRADEQNRRLLGIGGRE